MSHQSLTLRAREVEHQRATIAKLEEQIAAQEEATRQLVAAPLDNPPAIMAASAEESAELAGSTALVERRILENGINAREIAAEDALDTMVRLENRLKLETKKAALLQKENGTAATKLHERRKVLKSAEAMKKKALDVTGWNGQEMQADSAEADLERAAEMATLIARVEPELRAADVIIKKKEALVLFLEKELEGRQEQERVLGKMHNDIRVADRDLSEKQKEIDSLVNVDKSTQMALVTAEEDHDTVALDCVRGDNQFLQKQVAAIKASRRAIDESMRLQLERARELTARIDVIADAVRDLGLEREFNACMSRAIVAPAAVDRDPLDQQLLAPEDEHMPLAVYEVLHRDMSAMQEAVSRKDIMTLEKECVVRSLQDKFNSYEVSLHQATLQQRQTRDDIVAELGHLQAEINEKVNEYRRQIDAMMTENVRVKAVLAKRTSIESPGKGRWVRK